MEVIEIAISKMEFGIVQIKHEGLTWFIELKWVDGKFVQCREMMHPEMFKNLDGKVRNEIFALADNSLTKERERLQYQAEYNLLKEMYGDATKRQQQKVLDAIPREKLVLIFDLTSYFRSRHK